MCLSFSCSFFYLVLNVLPELQMCRIVLLIIRFHFKSIKLLAQNDIQALLMSAGRSTVFINISPYFMFCIVTSCFYWPARVLCPYKVDVWSRRIKRWILGVEMKPFQLFCIMSEIERNISSIQSRVICSCLMWVTGFRKKNWP